MGTTKNERLAITLEFLIRGKMIYNQQDFANKIGKSKSQLSEMLSGKLSISEQTVHRISSAFPVINEKWILLGNGEMIIESQQNEPQKSSEADLLKEMLREKDAKIESQAKEIGCLEERLEVLRKKSSAVTDVTDAADVIIAQ